MHYTVKTRDVDHSNTRRYKTRERAIKRFEEMVGYSMQAAIDETFYMMAHPPTPDKVTAIRAVSMFGCVVTFEELSDESSQTHRLSHTNRA